MSNEERGRVHGSLPSFLLGEGWVVVMTILFHFSGSEGQNTTPRRKTRRWPWPLPFPLLGSGGLWSSSPSITLLEGEKGGNPASTARGMERHWGH